MYFLWKQDIGVGHTVWLERLHWLSCMASNVWRRPLTSLCVNMCGEKWEVSQKHTAEVNSLLVCVHFYWSRCSQLQVWIHGCFRQHHRAEGVEWMIPFSPVIMGEGSQNCTQSPHFCSAVFRALILQEPLENGKDTSLFLLDWEECGTVLMVFAGLARLRPVCPFSSGAGM